MQIKTFFGWVLISIFSFLPVLAWFILGPGFTEFQGYSSITHSLGKLFGLVGMSMFALTFILSMRLKIIEKIFNGLDKVYIAHGVLGGLALFFILLHPLFLVLKFIPSSFYLAAKYLLPSADWSVNFGIIALFGLSLLIAITLFFKIKYEKWKFSHKFLGLVFILAVIHIFWIRISFVTDGIFEGYYLYAAIVSITGLVGFFYTLFLKNIILKEKAYRISSINKKGNVFEIFMVPKGKPIKYEKGQFIFVQFNNRQLSLEPHPFSLASSSNSEEIKIFIKKLGDFTAKLDVLKVGDLVEIEGPYGMFSKSTNKKDQVWIAAGIGITPFISMASDLIGKNSSKKIDLIYTAREDSEFIGNEVFSKLSNENKNFKCFFWNSQQKGRLNIKIISEIVGNLKDKEFFVCGPSLFKEGITKELLSKKITKKNIHEEAFEFK